MAGLETIKDFRFYSRSKSSLDKKRMGEFIKKNNKETDVPKNGRYFFERGKKVLYQLIKGDRLSPWWYRWVKNDEVRMSVIQTKLEYTFVEKDDDIVTEALAVNANQHYQYGDLILMKCDFGDYIKRRLRNKEISDHQLQAKLREFESHAREHGADMRKDELDKIVDGFTRV